MERSLPERFWKFVNRHGEIAANMDTRCWEWTGGIDKSGYGRFSWEGKTMGAHRASFLLAYGEQPEVVCHKCGVRHCVRPDHLYAGDTESNLIDIMLERIRRQDAA